MSTVKRLEASESLLGEGVFTVKIVGTSDINDEGSKYTMYKMLVNLGTEQWEVSRRYSEFEKMLHEKLQEDSIKIPGFPSKTILPSAQFDFQFICERQEALQKYFDRLLQYPNIRNNKILLRFLDPLYMPAVRKLKNIASIQGLMKCSYPRNTNKSCWILLYETKLYIYVSPQASHPDFSIDLIHCHITKENSNKQALKLVSMFSTPLNLLSSSSSNLLANNMSSSSPNLTPTPTPSPTPSPSPSPSPNPPIPLEEEEDNKGQWCVLYLRDKVNNDDEWLRLLTYIRVSADPMNKVFMEKLRKRDAEIKVEKNGLLQSTPLKKILNNNQSAVKTQTTRIERPSLMNTTSPVLYKNEPDSEKNIIYLKDGGIQAATKMKLIEKLCDHNFGIYETNPTLVRMKDLDMAVKNMADQIKQQSFESTYEKSTFVVAFMYTFNSFMTARELLDVLIGRFVHPPSIAKKLSDLDFKEKNNLTKEEELTVHPTRARIIEVLITWLEVHFYDFLEDRDLAKKLTHFIESNISSKGISSAGSAMLKDLIENKLQTKQPEPDVSKAPLPILPPCPFGGHFDLYDLSSLEVARQLTLKHFGMFKNIALKEFLSQKWSKPQAKLAPKIVDFMDEFNKCSYWVATYCTTPPSPKERAIIISKFIQVAAHCREFKNYHTTMTIISGLTNASVARLKLSWNLLPQRDLDTFEKLTELMSPNSNWSSYRNVLCNSSPPLLPYLGLFLADLTFIEDGNPDYVGPDQKLINFEKWTLESLIFKNIQKCQSSMYCLIPHKEIQKYIKHLTYVSSEKELFELSLKQEPRQIDK